MGPVGTLTGMSSSASQILGGLLAYGAIFLVTFVMILGPLVSEVVSSNSALLWIRIMYVPYLVVGFSSFMRNLRVFGFTLMVKGVIAVIAFNGFVCGVIT